MGTNHSTQNLEIFKTGTNGTEISGEKFQKIWKLMSFRKVNHSTKNSGNSRMKVKWNGNLQEKNFENLGIPHEVALYSGIYANSQFSTQCWLVLLATITGSWTSHAQMTCIR